MVKAADALAESGYRVHVVSTSWVDWAKQGDASLVQKRPGLWDWTVVDWNRASAPFKACSSGLRHRLARALVRWFAAKRCSLKVLGPAHVRISAELVRAARGVPCDLYYGGGGALAATAAAARRVGVPFALDLEDFHSAEQADSDEARISHQAAEQIERELLPAASFLTAGSAAIAAAYREKYDVVTVVLNNTFPLPASAPEYPPLDGHGLKMYWFSQTIGSNRGLEDVVLAMAAARITGELHLRGRPAAGYVESLQGLASRVAPKLTLVVHPPAAPDDMVELAQSYQIGLSVEPGFSENNRLALSNKAFTYILSGLAVVFTDTPGQHSLALDLGRGALLYRPGDVEALARGLRVWVEDKEALIIARRAAWEAARRRWHWEHPAERGALLEAVTEILGRN
jgi:hypothetical protein